MAAFKYFRLLFQNLTDTKFLITGEFLDKVLVSFCICRKICSCKFLIPFHSPAKPDLNLIWYQINQLCRNPGLKFYTTHSPTPRYKTKCPAKHISKPNSFFRRALANGDRWIQNCILIPSDRLFLPCLHFVSAGPKTLSFVIQTQICKVLIIPFEYSTKKCVNYRSGVLFRQR